jgi:hypothetical protein
VRRLHRQDLAEGGARLWDHHACHEPHVSPVTYHQPARTPTRYPHDTGITRPQRYKNHNDLHPCAQPRPAGRAQPR